MYGTRNTCTFYITNLIYCVNLLIRPPHDITWAKGERVTMLTWTLDQKIFQYQKNLYIIYTIRLFPEKYWLKYWLFHYKSIFPQSSLFSYIQLSSPILQIPCIHFWFLAICWNLTIKIVRAFQSKNTY